jgi:hypothetical protein
VLRKPDCYSFHLRVSLLVTAQQPIVDLEARDMTTPVVTTERGDEVAASATQYERWGWMVVRAGNRLLLAPNDHVSAVELPAALGAKVQHCLTVRLLAGPVIMLPGEPGRWLLLTESADEAAPVNGVRLHAQGGQVHCSGSLIPLPPSRLESGAVVWQARPSPEGPILPPFSAVVAAVRTVTETADLSAWRG